MTARHQRPFSEYNNNYGEVNAHILNAIEKVNRLIQRFYIVNYDQ